MACRTGRMCSAAWTDGEQSTPQGAFATTMPRKCHANFFRCAIFARVLTTIHIWHPNESEPFRTPLRQPGGSAPAVKFVRTRLISCGTPVLCDKTLDGCRDAVP